MAYRTSGLIIGLIALTSACKSSQTQTEPPAPAPAPTPVVEAPTPPPNAPAEPKVELATGELRRALLSLSRVHFGLNSSDLLPSGEQALRSAAEQLAKYPEVSIYVEGNADERGTSEYNIALGENRARIVKEYLVRLGISAERLRTVSYGEEKPLMSGPNPAAWALNRRVEFRLLQGDVEFVLEEGSVVDDNGRPLASADAAGSEPASANDAGQ